MPKNKSQFSVTLDNALIEEIKIHCIKQRRKLPDVIAELLREYLDSAAKGPPTKKLATSGDILTSAQELTESMKRHT